MSKKREKLYQGTCVYPLRYYCLMLHSQSYEAKIVELYKLPERMKVAEKQMSEEMLSNQVLSGIPEVDLGLE